MFEPLRIEIGPAYDISYRNLAANGVGHSCYGGFSDLLLFQEELLDLARVDVETA
jgi:hypothetical protein